MQQLIMLMLLAGSLVSCGSVTGMETHMVLDDSAPTFKFKRMGFLEGGRGYLVTVWDASTFKEVWKISTWVPPGMREAVLGDATPPNFPESAQDVLLQEVTYGKVPQGWYQIQPLGKSSPPPLKENVTYVLKFDALSRGRVNGTIYFRMSGACRRVTLSEFHQSVAGENYEIPEDAKCRFEDSLFW